MNRTPEVRTRPGLALLALLASAAIERHTNHRKNDGDLPGAFGNPMGWDEGRLFQAQRLQRCYRFNIANVATLEPLCESKGIDAAV